MEILATEIQRILTCPYLPSLKPLHNIIRRDDVSVHAWARGNPCQIGPLVQTILEGLESWPYVLDILKHLSQAAVCRDEVLNQSPTIIDTLLQKATESESGHEKYSSVCISLLCTPLDLVIPATFPAFLSRLLMDAVRNLSYETIRPVYQTISCINLRSLDDLPAPIVSQVQDSLIKVLARKDVEEVSTGLFSLAVLARLASWETIYPSPKGSTPNSDSNALKSGQILPPACQFFNAKRAFKTLDLVTFKAIAICSSACTIGSNAGVECLRLCVEIVQVIEGSERSSWATQNPSKMKKLIEKVLRPGIDNDVQWVALDFLMRLTDPRNLPLEIMKTCETLILKPHIHLLDSQALLCLSLVNNSFVEKILRFLLGQACEALPMTSDSLLKLENATKVAGHLATAISKSPDLCQMASGSMSSKEGLVLLDQFITGTKILYSEPDLDSVYVCHCAFQRTHLRLREMMTFVLLSSAFRSSEAGQDAFRSVMIPLLENRTGAAQIHCSKHTGKIQYSPVSVFETGSTPRTISISHNWREIFTQDMIRDANHRSDSIIRMIGEICRDLEVRCEEVERPLRKEQARSRDLETKVQRWEDKIKELEMNAVQADLKIKDINFEKETLEQQVIARDVRLHDLSNNLDKIQAKCQLTEASAQRAIDTMGQSARQQDLAYIATLTSKDEMFEKQTLKLANSDHRVRALENELARMGLHQQEIMERGLEGTRTIEELRKSHLEQEDLLKYKGVEISRLVESEITAKAMTNELSVKAAGAAREHDDIVAALESQLMAAKVDLADLEELHSLKALENAAELSRSEERLQATVGNMQAELQQVRDEAVKALQARDGAIAELESAIGRCLQDHQARERESADAADLLKKLTAIVATKDSKCLASTMVVNGVVPASDGEDAVGSRFSETVKNPREDRSGRASFSSDQRSLVPKRSRTKCKLRSPLATGGKVNVRMAVGAPRSADRMPLPALFGSTPTPNWEVTTPKQSYLPGGTFTTHDKALHQGKEDINLPIKAVETFGGGDIYVSPNQHQLLAPDKDVSSCTFDETPSAL